MSAPGAEGYDADAEVLARRFEQVRTEEKLRPVLHLLPDSPASVLDVGAGSGVDAAWLVSRGHDVVAVEPSAGLRRQAAALHPSTRIAWVDDSLPSLSSLAAPARFDFILAAGVWNHLDEAERSAAIARLASLLESAGTLVLSIRHGPPPSGRRSFPASAEQAIAYAAACGLQCILEAPAESMQPGNRASGITWTWLAFQAPSGFLRQ